MKLYIEPQSAIPLVWFDIRLPWGSVTDPIGQEGLCYHTSGLARRGAGAHSRTELDDVLDGLGASVELGSGRDGLTVSGLCLTRNLPRVIELTGDILAAPRMAPEEHRKLLRETQAALDELRDDDAEVAARFFNHLCAPGHPYARTSLGTEQSLNQISLDDAHKAWSTFVVRSGAVFGFAGDISDSAARQYAQQLWNKLPDTPTPPRPTLPSTMSTLGRRLCIVDKPDRSQSQVIMGHGAPSFGSEDYLALSVVEAAFGGTFTSRLMQEIRVKRGWSYDTGCQLGRARGGHWLRIFLAPSEEVTPEAIAVVCEMYERLRTDGLSNEELEFCKAYLAGSVAFSLATPQARMRIATSNALLGLPDGFAERLPQRLNELTPQQVNQAIERWLRPDQLLTVVVASRSTMYERLANCDLGTLDCVAYNSY